jgi:hypothetical protein
MSDDKTPPVEMCFKCDQPTGFAGKHEDSIYCQKCCDGPFCELCWERDEDWYPESCRECRIKDAPPLLYLQCLGTEDVAHCSDQIYPSDICYQLAKPYDHRPADEKQAEIDRLTWLIDLNSTTDKLIEQRQEIDELNKAFQFTKDVLAKSVTKSAERQAEIERLREKIKIIVERDNNRIDAGRRVITSLRQEIERLKGEIKIHSATCPQCVDSLTPTGNCGGCEYHQLDRVLQETEYYSCDNAESAAYCYHRLPTDTCDKFTKRED